MYRISFATTAAIFLSTALLAQTPEDYSFRQNFPVTEPARMSISTDDGFIKSYGKPIREIQVYFIVIKNNRVVDIKLDELEEHLQIEIESSSNVVEISVKQRDKSWLWNWKDRYYVSLHILAPRQTESNLKTSDGDITLNGFIGQQHCKTSDGDIEVIDLDGNLNARTSDGEIDVHNINGNIDLITSDGDIAAENITGTVELKTSDGDVNAFDIEGDTHATTSDGKITLENIRGQNSARTSDGNIIFKQMYGAIEAQTSDGDIHGELRKVTGRLYLKTSDGDISVSVPDDLGMNIRLKGEGIHTTLEHFSGNTSDNLIEGTIRGGGVEVEMITSDGDISLNYN